MKALRVSLLHSRRSTHRYPYHVFRGASSFFFISRSGKKQMEMLTEMGFGPREAEAALARSNNDVELAASLLLALTPSERTQLVESGGSRAPSQPTNDEPKMVLCARTDLSMSCGKLCSQCAHAAVDLFRAAQEATVPQQQQWLAQWLSGGCAKIALALDSEAQLHELHAMAVARGLPAVIIADAGRTQIASGTVTTLGIGPAPRSLVDEVTGKLRLL